MQVTLVMSSKIDEDAFYRAIGNYDPSIGWNGVNTDADAFTEAAGRICYASWNRPNPKTASNRDYLAHILQQRHYSVMEHATATFHISGVTRNLLLEEERHRFLCHSVRSQRYVAEGPTDYAVHPTLEKEGYAETVGHAWRNQWATYETVAESLVAKGYSRKEAREAARHFLLSCGATEYFVTANLRAWREFVAKRMYQGADKEIQEMAGLILAQLKEIAPNCFQDFQVEAAPEERVAKYRKLPIEVEAVRWTGSNLSEMASFAGAMFQENGPEDQAEDPEMTAQIYDELHSTWVSLRTGDWVLRGIKGEFYPCAAEVFQATYQSAS